ncbi:hypothetical protein F4781DRAFT_313218 [Annulohypoxylon bovei var. microspora]|nr:hypothetical protein F4781DRAFT_313218 [Annulohypoxylon bovei var. microspora]
MAFINRFQASLSWLWGCLQQRNPCHDETHVGEPTPDNDVPVSDDVEELSGSDHREPVNSEDNHCGTEGAPHCRLDHNGHIFYARDPYSSNAYTKACTVGKSSVKQSCIAMSAVKWLYPDAKLGTKCTISWQVEDRESMYSTLFEVVSDDPAEYQIVLGMELSVNNEEGQSCVASNRPQDQPSIRDKTHIVSNDQDQRTNSRFGVPYDTSHSSEHTHDSHKVIPISSLRFYQRSWTADVSGVAKRDVDFNEYLYFVSFKLENYCISRANKFVGPEPVFRVDHYHG